jgi:hypothetical protein
MPDDVEVFTSILKVLEDVGILSDIVIIGGWAQHLYRRYFNDPPELSALRTTDIDILFARPPGIIPKKNLEETLEPLGFKRSFTADGSTKFISREVEIEFLIPDRGRGDAGPYHIKELSISAQSLRLVNMLTIAPVEVQYNQYVVKVPDPIRFFFHKLLVSQRRDKENKREKDRITAFELASLLCQIPQWRELIPSRFTELSKKQRSLVSSLLTENNNLEVIALLT